MDRKKRFLKSIRRWFSIAKKNSETVRCSDPVFEPFRELEVIVLKVDFLGDFILAIPALAALKEKVKSDKIDIVVGEWNVEVAQKAGLFRNVYVYNGLARYEISKQKIAEEERLLQADLPPYDVAIELRRGKDSRELMQWINASCKIGCRSYKDASKVLDICLDNVEDLHESLQMMRLVDAVPVRAFILPSLGSLQQLGKRQEISIFPFAGNPMKEWPLQNYVELVRQLLEHKQVEQINVFCSQAEADKMRCFKEQANVRVLIGLGVEPLISLLKSSNVVVSNDSFGAHLASYLRIPVIAIYSGQTRPLEWQPSFGPMTILSTGISCSRCNSTDKKNCALTKLPICLQQIKQEIVLAEICKMLASAEVGLSQENRVILLDGVLGNKCMARW